MTRARAVRRILLPPAAALLLALSAPPALAAPEHLGAHGPWDAWKSEDGGSCYAVSGPGKEEGDYTRRGEVHAFVEVRPGGSAGVVSFKAGYPFREESAVEVEIAGQGTFSLYTRGDAAWAYDRDDAALVAAMRRGLAMVVRGVSSRGTETTDTYDLRGFTAAVDAIRSACAG